MYVIVQTDDGDGKMMHVATGSNTELTARTDSCAIYS